MSPMVSTAFLPLIEDSNDMKYELNKLFLVHRLILKIYLTNLKMLRGWLHFWTAMMWNILRNISTVIGGLVIGG